MLSERIGSEIVLYVQNPLQLDRHTELYPDLMLLRPRPDAYAEHLPVPQDVLLLIEVAEHSLHTDQQQKLPRYVEAGIPEIWMVDAAKKQVSIYTQPSPVVLLRYAHALVPLPQNQIRQAGFKLASERRLP